MQFFWTLYSLKNAGKIYNHTALSWAANQQIIIESKLFLGHVTQSSTGVISAENLASQNNSFKKAYFPG